MNQLAARSLLTVAVAFAIGTGSVDAQQPPSAGTTTNPTVVLPQQQAALAQRYEQLEQILLKLADVAATSDPQRSALLRQAARQGRDGLIHRRLLDAVAALDAEQLQAALDHQQGARSSLEALLKLLQSEARTDRNREEQERLRNLLRDLQRLERAQRATQARTESGADAEAVSKEQAEVEQRTKELRERVARDAGLTPESGEQTESSNDSSSTETKTPGPDQQAPEQEQPSGQPTPEGQPTPPSEPRPSESDNPSNQGANDSPEQQATGDLQQAQDSMKQAQQQLKQGERPSASQSQEKAAEQLRQAADRIDQALRQLREEEKQRQLARLESRLRSIYEQQADVLSRTQSLRETSSSNSDRQVEVQAGNLGFAENKIVADVDRALLLLAEAAESVAFPEALQQARRLMVRVAGRLNEVRLDDITVSLQEDILASLEEMISAIEQEQKRLEEQQQQPSQQPSPSDQQGEQALVDALAELRLIQRLQQRVQRSTERYSKMLTEPDDEVGEAIDPELRDLVRELADQQVRLFRATRDLVQRQEK
jgi:hypothetical protein